MKFKEPEGKTFEPLEEGVDLGVCIGMVDVGTSDNPFDDEKRKHQVLVIWEMPNQTMEAKDKDTGEVKEVTRTISKFYNMSLDARATLRKHLEAWRGKSFTADELKGFDAQNLIGKGCMVQILNKENAKGEIKSRVESVMALMKGQKAPKPTHETVYFSFEDQPDTTVLSEGLLRLVTESDEFKAQAKGKTDIDVVDDINDKLDEGAEEEADSDNIPF